MAFSEKLKKQIRKRCHMRCCLCHDIGVEIHHIVPQAQNGADDERNAAPLCPTCHNRYGANPDKRKFLTECRDNWYEICDNRYSNESELQEMRAMLHSLVDANDGTATNIGSKKEFSSIGEILQLIYDVELSDYDVRLSDQSFLFDFLFGGSIGENFDRIKQRFIELFGVETAKKMCGFSLIHWEQSFSDGFTEAEIDQLAGMVEWNMRFLCFNQELNPEEPGIRVVIRDDKNLVAYASREPMSDSVG